MMMTQATLPKTEQQATAKDLVAKRAVAEGIEQYLAILPTSDAKAAAAMFAVFRANYAQYLANNRSMDGLGLPVAVTGKRLAILRTLYFSPQRQLTLGSICKTIRLSPAAATNYVDSLSRGSLVRRYCSPEDRHANLIQLTPKGEDAFVRIASALGRRWAEACACFTDEEKDILIRLLSRLAK